MKRAHDLFAFDRRPSTSSLVSTIWHTQSVPEETFISVAVSHWEMVVTRHGAGGARLSVRGPETKATCAAIPQDAEFFGIQFSLGTFMPGFDLRQLVDRSLTMPPASSTSFWLHGEIWELPSPENADVFVDRLARAGLLVHDRVASAAVQGDVDGLSVRSIERRVARATGLTRGAVRQIGRADQAVAFLSQGMSPPDAASRAGYADQSHLTRALRRFVGQTPSEIAAGL